MNKTRRKELSDIIKRLNMIHDKENLYDCINTLENIKDEEKDYYDNIPENLQYSQRAEDSETAIENLEEALDLLNKVYDMDELNKTDDSIQRAIDLIENAKW